MKEAALALAYTGGAMTSREQMDPWQSRTLIVLASAVVVLCSLPILCHLVGVDFSSVALGAFQPIYSLISWSAVMLVALTAILALAHFGIEPEDVTTPLVGVGLLGCGVVDGFYALQVLQQGGQEQLTADGWWLSRAFTALVLVLVVSINLGLLRWVSLLKQDYKELYATAIMAVLFCLLAVSVVYGFQQAGVPSLPVAVRKFLPTAFLFLSLPLAIILYSKVRTLLSGTLVLMVVPMLTLELHMVFGFGQPFDNHFNIAIALKTLAVLTPMVGLLCQYIYSYRAVEGAKRELVINQRKLDVALETLTRSNERLTHANCHDHLTGAANREYFFREAERAISRARRSKQRVGFLYLDLDKFKQVNDAFGHSVGDEVLCCFAERIRGVMRREDCLARVGGDEFVLMVENVSDIEHLSAVAEKIIDMLSMPVQTAKGELDVAVSIGISAFPETKEITDLVKHADIAMYEAKANETSKFQIYTKELSVQHAENLLLQRQLPEALREGQLSLAFQPIFNASSLKPMAVEALLRWDHPEMGAISPAKFVPIAEKSTFINTLGTWVFEQACQQLSFWREHHGLELAMGVNISVRQLYADNLVTTIKRCLMEYSIPAADITLEITEGQMIQDLQACQGTIEALKKLGVKIALDDYGSGFASITHLRNLPIDFLKIDRSLIRNAPRNPQNRVLTRTTIELAHSLELPVIAEGIEEVEELELVSQYRCDFVQGYYLARPMPAEACTDFLVEALSEAEVVNV